MSRRAAFLLRSVLLLAVAGLLFWWGSDHLSGDAPQKGGEAKAPAAAGPGGQAQGQPGGQPGGQAQARGGKAPVSVALTRRADFPIEIKAVGTVEASASVGIKARVGGELTRVHFTEGQEVKKGDLLFTIDPRPLQAALSEAQAKLERDRALLAKASEDYRRYQDLERQKIVSREQFEQVFSNVSALRATVRADEAAVESARVQVEYSAIRSPIDGRVGRLLQHMGNMVKANDDDPLVTIVQMEPVYATFALPEERLPAVLAAMRAGEVAVLAEPAEAAAPEKGRLFFVDNLVDRKTGTITLKAEFANKERLLWPGRFVTVSVRLGVVEGAVIAPARAVQTGLEGQYVWVIDDADRASLRTVTTGRSSEQEVVIRTGLEPGERVVVDGHLRVTPGAVVEVKDGGTAPAKAPPAPGDASKAQGNPS